MTIVTTLHRHTRTKGAGYSAEGEGRPTVRIFRNKIYTVLENHHLAAECFLGRAGQHMEISLVEIHGNTATWNAVEGGVE